MSVTRSPRSFFLQSPPPHIYSQGRAANKNLLRRRHLSSSSTQAAGGSSSSAIFGKIFFPSLCAITFTLGTWQTKRYFEKIDMVQKRKDDLSLDPLSFEQWRLLNHPTISNLDGASSSSSRSNSSDEASSKSYRRVVIQGKFDHTNSILIGPRGPPPGALATSGPNSGMGGGGGMSSSTQGYWVVTPLIVGEEENRLNEGHGGKEVDSSLSKEEDGWLGRLLLPWRRRRSSSNNTATSDQQQSHDIKSGSDTVDSAMSTKSSSSDKIPTTTTVWINRGWIPRHYINQNTNQILQSWDEPMEHVTVLSMESQTEKGGGMFTPPSRIDVVGGKGGSNNRNGAGVGNDEKKSVKKLLWMDREAMEEIMTNSCTDDHHPPLFVQINTTNTADDNEPKTFPVQPSEEYVGEFKVTPDVHMGYAVTWFGSSGAGVIMTRKLLTRGR
eukprot:scaffold819_cov146-Skeletonema_menzelii.AAC.3